MIAINDAFMLESSVYILLKKYFRQETYYVDLIELFHEVGQSSLHANQLYAYHVV